MIMDWNKILYAEDEKPLDRIIDGYSFTSIFRKIAFVGDSMSSGEFESCDENGNKSYHDMFEYSWGQYIARKNGLTAYNFSRGGMTAKEYIDSFAASNGFWDKDKACQAYVIALGANDIFNFKIETGTIDDIKNGNTDTYIGAYAEIVKRYKEISPDAKFFFVTLPCDLTFGPKDLLEKTKNAIYTLADYFDNSYVIDLYTYAPAFDEKFREKYFLYGHMNAMGYILIAEFVDSYIDYIIRHNTRDFMLIPFIEH